MANARRARAVAPGQYEEASADGTQTQTDDRDAVVSARWQEAQASSAVEMAKGKPKPFKLTSPEATEDELHKAVADLLHIVLLPPAIWSTFPSGMYQLPRSAGGRLKAYGLKEGVPDVFALHDGHVVWLELKRRHGVISKVQKAMHEKLEANKTSVYICRSLEAVVDALWREGFPLRKGIVHNMLAGHPYQPAERQRIGELYRNPPRLYLAQEKPENGTDPERIDVETVNAQ